MERDTISIEKFLTQVFQKPVIAGVIQHWNIDIDVVRGKIAKTFYEMGFFTVRPEQHPFFTGLVLQRLEKAPEIRKLLREAEAAEKLRPKNRHSE